MKEKVFQNPKDYNSICLSSGIGVTYFMSEENMYIHLYDFLPLTEAGRGGREEGIKLPNLPCSFFSFLLLI